MDRSMTFGQTFVHLIGPRQKPPAEGHWKLPGGWNWQKHLMEKCTCNTIQSMHIYAYLCHIYAICLDMPERITIFGWNSVDVTRRRRHAPGQAGGGASRITWLGAETTSSDGRSCDILHTDIHYIHELWYINGNRSSVHRACGIGSTLMNFIAKAEEKQRGRYHLNGICLWKDSCFDTWPSNCQDAAAANSFVAFLHYTWRAF